MSVDEVVALDGPAIDLIRGCESEWEFCWNRLVEVSRTFSRPIEMLPDELQVAVCCGYLLCRTVDTVEDHPDLPVQQRDRLYEAFLKVVEQGKPAEAFSRPFSEVPGEGPEHRLGENLDKVITVFERLPDAARDVCREWIAEMTRGMQLYSHRHPDERGLITVHSLADLERYCYYVAGTVGHLLTGLFLHEIGDDVEESEALRMKETAERFGLALQMVNILKDQTDDLQRGRGFIPRQLAERQGLHHAELYEEEHRREAHRAVEPVFERAREHLDAALDYTLSIPASYPSVRLFCLLPLWMAVRTIVHADGNDAMFIEGEPVKISRDEVESLIGECVENVADDDALRNQFADLW